MPVSVDDLSEISWYALMLVSPPTDPSDEILKLLFRLWEVVTIVLQPVIQCSVTDMPRCHCLEDLHGAPLDFETEVGFRCRAAPY